MVKPVGDKPQANIVQARPDHFGQFNGRAIAVFGGKESQLSNFVAGGNSDFQTYYKIVKVSCILTVFVPLIALAADHTVLAGLAFTAGSLTACYSFAQMYLAS